MCVVCVYLCVCVCVCHVLSNIIQYLNIVVYIHTVHVQHVAVSMFKYLVQIVMCTIMYICTVCTYIPILLVVSQI